VDGMGMIRWMIYSNIVSSQIIGMKFIEPMVHHLSLDIDIQLLFVEVTSISLVVLIQINRDLTMSINLILIRENGVKLIAQGNHLNQEHSTDP